MNPIARIASNYDVDANGCWLWRGHTRNGYGRLMLNRVMVTAHRWFYEQHVGPIPAGLQLDHLCRNRTCVNPAHLEPVTNAENARRGAMAKLTAADVIAIREAPQGGRALARRFGVGRSQIGRIRRGEQWADVEAAA